MSSLNFFFILLKYVCIIFNVNENCFHFILICIFLFFFFFKWLHKTKQYNKYIEQINK
jgi:hypothetical protein